ncbi:glycosyltransferase family 87 protein [Streptomyces chiangmaiensis]|uniref:Glycosyltransferase family 87 protein n=1 Tax=Streptomyces chiangmaiensis TaxID=766497 RepID=A0ABU7FE31_9ACTN|nr:glycosyltransferase family 87 protein [Streptomyces chiangmaiensis]MED7822068.1 glycosyltransferase family 87 protein [Streptomyces chiangmaiensis]
MSDIAAPRRHPSRPLPSPAAAPTNRISARISVIVTAVLLAALTAVVFDTVRAGDSTGDPGRLLAGYAVAWTLFAAAVWAVRRAPTRAATGLVLAGAGAVALAALAAPPRTSNDMFRYAWDGRVQAAGISPYAHPPAAPELATLRDDWLFPTEGACRGWGLTHTDSGLCVRINRPTVPTIYPPVAEGWFFAVHALSPSDGRHKPHQVGGAVLAFGTTIALLTVGRRRGDPRRAPARAALWGWCPAVPFEAVNNAHIDALGVLLTVLALGTVATGARRGALLGAAIAVKLLPVLVLPGALSGQRSPARVARVVSASLAVVAIAYLPYVIASGAGVLGYLPGYLQEEGYEPGDVHRFALLRLLLPDTAAGATVIVLLVLTALYVWWCGDPARPWRGALLLTGTALLLVSPNYPWYSLLLVGLVALDGRWEWLTVTMAGTVLYLGGRLLHGFPLQAWAYGAAAVCVALGACLRTAPAREFLERRRGRSPGCT